MLCISYSALPHPGDSSLKAYSFSGSSGHLAGFLTGGDFAVSLARLCHRMGLNQCFDFAGGWFWALGQRHGNAARVPAKPKSAGAHCAH